MTQLTWLDRAIAWLSPSWGLQRAGMRRGIEAVTQYRGASRDRLRADWSLSRHAPTGDTYERQDLRNRARDLNCNDAISAGLTGTIGLNVAGTGLRGQSALRADRVGMTEGQADAYRAQAENIWAEWCKTPDAGERLTFDEIQLMTVMKVIEDGELSILPTWIEKPWKKLARSLDLVECDRMESPASSGTTHGIKVGKHGEPLTYYFRKADENGNLAYDFEEIAARDESGRPKVFHLFRPTRPGQLRGTPLFAPVLALFKDFSDVREAYVVKERIQACLAVIFTKDGNAVENAYAHSTDTENTTKTASPRLQQLEPGLIYYNERGDKVDVVDPGKTGESQAAFIESTLRIIGAAVGMPYELVLKDFSKTNYSSARAALLEGRRVFQNWRGWLASKLCQPTWEMVLEEAYLRGMLDAPRFEENRAEYLRATWIGGGWGWVDPVKEIMASKLAIENGLSTLQAECAGQGNEWEETLEQIGRELRKRKSMNLRLAFDTAMNQPAPAAAIAPKQSPKEEEPTDEE